MSTPDETEATHAQVYFDLSMYDESLADFEASMAEDRAGDEESETYYETRARPASWLFRKYCSR